MGLPSYPGIFQDGDDVSKAETPEVAAMSQLQRDIQQQLEDEQQRREDKQRELELLGRSFFLEVLWSWFMMFLFLGGVGCGGEAIRELGNGREQILGGTIDTIDCGGMHHDGGTELIFF